MRAPRTLALLALCAMACSGPPPAERSRPPRSHAAPASPPPITDVAPLPPSTFAAPARLVAIGDVHGDLDAFQSALRAGGAIDADAHWSGGALFVVQTGDLLDRGDQERAILDFVDGLEDEALAAGGRLLVLNGNHELMNTEGDFRYVTPGGYADFDALASDAHGPLYDELPSRVRGRVVAFHPGGPYARLFATHLVIAIVGDTLFVHGGATVAHLARGLDAINQDARRFFLGEAPLASELQAGDGPVWYRGFATGDDAETCARLGEALAAAHVARMVIGHTVQEDGITSACDGRVWRIDVGLARAYGGPIQALEITPAGTRVLARPRD
jgi:hypothetical protein